ncbi:MAG: hypothetical protein CFE21_06600 [Bacteroidetes bacterium B1(2017)]|nr:MAG: hypothetical protein CFE21_06600 [Bacteroidetes bacterium B1(2017)]
MKLNQYTFKFFLGISILFASCEKEIQINVPPSKEELVVEASINQLTPTLNYVILSKTLDYFNPSLSLAAVSGAQVFITEGSISGMDTFYAGNRTQFYDLLDTIIPGIYLNPLFTGKAQTPYLLEVELADGRKISGKTFIPKPVVIDSIHYWFEPNKKDTNAFFYLQWFDGPEQNNYRVVLKKGFIPFLTGWGYGDRFYTFDDKLINNQERPFQMLNPYKYGDTVNVYLAQIGRPEFVFWDSFRSAANNGGPFATPVSVKSNVTGAIGSFTGYGLTQEQLILK